MFLKLFEKNRFYRRALSLFALSAFVLNTLIFHIGISHAQEVFQLPAPGTLVELSPAFKPPVLKGIKVYPKNPFRLDFILSKGDSNAVDRNLEDESIRLIKYFLASITVPEKDLWVNLSPYEKDRIVPVEFGKTEMGRDLLDADYLLKQITASIIYPESEIGKKFWEKIYEKAHERYGTTEIPVDTFNKVWIVPGKATVYENAQLGSAYIVDSRLKVMLESDYLAREKNVSPASENETQEFAKDIIREIVIPELEREINEGKNFATLRQVYQSLILATWFKKKIKGDILNKIYVDKNKISGINVDNPQVSVEIWNKYVAAFKKGVFDFIREDTTPDGEAIPRKYFAGGVDYSQPSPLTVEMVTDDVAPPSIENGENVQVSIQLVSANPIDSSRITKAGAIRAAFTSLNSIVLGGVILHWFFQPGYTTSTRLAGMAMALPFFGKGVYDGFNLVRRKKAPKSRIMNSLVLGALISANVVYGGHFRSLPHDLRATVTRMISTAYNVNRSLGGPDQGAHIEEAESKSVVIKASGATEKIEDISSAVQEGNDFGKVEPPEMATASQDKSLEGGKQDAHREKTSISTAPVRMNYGVWKIVHHGAITFTTDLRYLQVDPQQFNIVVRGGTSTIDLVKQYGAVAGINGGYLTELVTPTGLVIVDGQEAFPYTSPFLDVELKNGEHLSVPAAAYLKKQAPFDHLVQIRFAKQYAPGGLLIEDGTVKRDLNLVYAKPLLASEAIFVVLEDGRVLIVPSDYYKSKTFPFDGSVKIEQAIQTGPLTCYQGVVKSRHDPSLEVNRGKVVYATDDAGRLYLMTTDSLRGLYGLTFTEFTEKLIEFGKEKGIHFTSITFGDAGGSGTMTIQDQVSGTHIVSGAGMKYQSSSAILLLSKMATEQGEKAAAEAVNLDRLGSLSLDQLGALAESDINVLRALLQGTVTRSDFDGLQDEPEAILKALSDSGHIEMSGTQTALIVEVGVYTNLPGLEMPPEKINKIIWDKMHKSISILIDVWMNADNTRRQRLSEMMRGYLSASVSEDSDFFLMGFLLRLSDDHSKEALDFILTSGVDLLPKILPGSHIHRPRFRGDAFFMIDAMVANPGTASELLRRFSVINLPADYPHDLSRITLNTFDGLTVGDWIVVVGEKDPGAAAAVVQELMDAGPEGDIVLASLVDSIFFADKERFTNPFIRALREGGQWEKFVDKFGAILAGWMPDFEEFYIKYSEGLLSILPELPSDLRTVVTSAFNAKNIDLLSFQEFARTRRTSPDRKAELLKSTPEAVDKLALAAVNSPNYHQALNRLCDWSLTIKDAALQKRIQRQLVMIYNRKPHRLMGSVRGLAAAAAQNRDTYLEKLAKKELQKSEFLILLMRLKWSTGWDGDYKAPLGSYQGIIESLSKPREPAMKSEAMGASMLSQTRSEDPGGIDLNPNKINLQIQNSDGEIEFDIDPAMLERLQDFLGFSPVIIDIQPLESVQMFLGLKSASRVSQ